jgi:hypothetical protein
MSLDKARREVDLGSGFKSRILCPLQLATKATPTSVLPQIYSDQSDLSVLALSAQFRAVCTIQPTRISITARASRKRTTREVFLRGAAFPRTKGHPNECVVNFE